VIQFVSCQCKADFCILRVLLWLMMWKNVGHCLQGFFDKKSLSCLWKMLHHDLISAAESKRWLNLKKVILTRIEGQKCPAPSFTGYFLGDLRQYAAGFHFNCDTGQVQAAFQVDNRRKHEDELKMRR